MHTERTDDAALEAELLALLLEEEGFGPLPDEAIEPADVDEPPLSFAQQRLWFLDRLVPGNPFYNVPSAVRLSGALVVPVLERTLAEIVRRHAALRTTFALVDGRPVQQIAPAATASLTLIDLSLLSETEREAEAHQLATKEARIPFDLTTGPLLRTILLCLGEREHVLLFTMHHIVSDGWSIGVLIHELGALYTAFAGGRPSPLPELKIQYADFAVWQRHRLQGTLLAEQLAYWQQQLDGVPPLALPTDFPRPPVQTFQGATAFIDLPPALTGALEALGQRSGSTLFMTLLAAFGTLLHRYTGQSQIVIGSPIANRNRSEIEGLIGFFVNTLVLCTDLSGDPDFLQLLDRVRRVTLDAYSYQDFPFEKLVEELQLERDLSRNPLFQVLFAVQNAPTAAFNLPGLTLNRLDIEPGTTRFDLELHIWERPEGLRCQLMYSTDLFEAASMARLLGHFQQLLLGIVAKPRQPLSALSLLTTAESQQLALWNETGVPATAPSLQALFEAQAARTPEAFAVVFGKESLTYRQLDEQANQLAHHLQKLGVGPEVPVGLYLERSLAMLVGLLGILKAGGAYVPLDPSYPENRRSHILADAQVPVLVSDSRFQGDAALRTVYLDRDAGEIAKYERTAPQVEPDPAALAYVLYTSGSTGEPKGVAMPHGALTNLLAWQSTVLAAPARTLQYTSLNFDVSCQEIFSTWQAGGTLVLVTEETRRDGAALVQLLEDAAIERLFVPFVALQMVAQAVETTGTIPLHLREIVTAGEQLQITPAIARLARLTGASLHNHYGPTESHVASTFTLKVAVEDWPGLPPIGSPIGGTQVYLLDTHRQPVPVGVPGELMIAGSGLARGYLYRPEWTAEKFIPNPFGPAGTRLYCTGDLARYRSDGTIEYLGRLDGQVKIRGFRIEPGEVEAALSRHPGVAEVVVAAREEVGGHRRLFAYVVPTAQPPDTATLRSYLKEKLPGYMVPSGFVFLEALPLTASGKIDRRALAAIAVAPPETGHPSLPRTAIEATLVEVWSTVLGVPVGVDDNFFALGGDSILSIQVIDRANRAGLAVTPRQLFAHQTIAELAAVTTLAPRDDAQSGPVHGPLPLTPIQHWFFEQQSQDLHHWNMAALLEVPDLDPTHLQKAVAGLLAHHDGLRTRFSRATNGWQATIAESEPGAVFQCIDFSTVPENEQQEALEAAAAQVQGSLNLEHGPLVRVVLFNLGTTRTARLLIVIHHLVVDGVSLRILLDALKTGYQQSIRGEAVQLPARTTAYATWADKLLAHARTDTLSQETYWHTVKPAATHLPLDYPGGTNTVASARTVPVSLSVEETRALLQEVPSAYGTEINDVLLTALVQALSTWIHEDSICLNLEGHGREALFEGIDLSRTVGWFTAIFPVQLTLPRFVGPGEALKSVKEQLRAVPGRGVGYGLLRYLGEGEVAGIARAHPQPEVSFNYLGQLDPSLGEWTLAPESAGPLLSPRAERFSRLYIGGAVLGGQLQMHFEYSENFHRQGTIATLAGNFRAALLALIDHCRSAGAGGYTPSDFPESGLNQQELDDLLAELGDLG